MPETVSATLPAPLSGPFSERPDFFACHQDLIEQAVTATAERDHWSAYADSFAIATDSTDTYADTEPAAFEENSRA